MYKWLNWTELITFHVSRRRREMYSGHSHARVRVSVARRIFPHDCTDPDVTWRNGRGCPLVVDYWADLQSVHGFRCYDNSAEREMSASACTRSMPGFVIAAIFVWFCKRLHDSYRVNVYTRASLQHDSLPAIGPNITYNTTRTLGICRMPRRQ